MDAGACHESPEAVAVTVVVQQDWDCGDDSSGPYLAHLCPAACSHLVPLRVASSGHEGGFSCQLSSCHRDRS
jgi:hypothetical protein